MGSCSPDLLSRSETQTPASALSIASENVARANVQGKVQSVQDQDNEIIILSPEDDKIALYIADQSKIWDGRGWMAEIPVEIGDDAIATGFWNEDGSVFIVQNLYINIVYLKGVVDEVDKEELQFELDDPRQGRSAVLVSDFTEVLLTIHKQQGNFQVMQTLPDVGNYIEIIGRKLHSGAILAVHITIY